MYINRNTTSVWLTKPLCLECNTRRPYGGRSICGRCKSRAKFVIWAKKNPERIKATQARRKERIGKSAINSYHVEWCKRLKEEIFNHYGGMCLCCGEHNYIFLTIDHVNNDGATDRKRIRQSSWYSWIKRNNFPTYLQLLCFNCNIGRHMNKGTCPHGNGI